MKHIAEILAVVLAFGCGTPTAPAQHAPTGAVQDDAGTDAQTTPETHQEDTLAPAYIILENPFTDIGPGCKKSVPPIPDASLPIITSEKQLEELLGCKTTMAVDWSKEHVVPVTLDGVNKGWSFVGLSTKEGVTTITIRITTIMRGAAVFEKEFWLVRIPASSKSAVLEWTSSPQKLDGPLYP
jgi:hypothetical protein